MKKWFLHILLLAGLFGVLTTSCSQEDGLEPQASDETVQVMFTIALDGPSARSRATWGDNYDNNDTNDYDSAIGDDFDNYIDPDKFFVKLTLGTNTYDVKNIAYWQQPDPNKNIYEFVGEVEVNISQTTSYTDAKVMVYANMTPATTTGNETFATDYNTYPGTGVKYIPMWGVQTIPNLSLTPGASNMLPDIYLLRAMAKVEVIMKDTDPNHAISDIKLNRYNTMGYCLPKGWDKTTIAATTDLDLEEVLRPSTNIRDTNESFTESTVNGFKCYTVYVPDYLNIAPNSQTSVTPSTITVTIGGKNYDIKFKKYADGVATDVAYNIVRNHIYRYNITAVNDGAELELDLTVTPWSVNQSTVDYRNEASYSGDRGIVWNNNVEPTTNNGIVLNDDLQEVSFSFNLATPRGGRWYAELVKISGADGAFQFKDANNNLSQGIDGTIDGNSRTLTIVATQADADVTENNEFLLKIYVETPALEGTTPRRTDVTNLLGAYTIVQSKQMNN